MLNINQIVKGKVGQFVIIGFRTIDNEQYAQVKPYDPTTQKTGRGELALPVSILQAV